MQRTCSSGFMDAAKRACPGAPRRWHPLKRIGRARLLGGVVLVGVLCLPYLPPRASVPSWSCWVWRVPETLLGPATCPQPCDGGSKSCGNKVADEGPARCAYRGQRRSRSRTWQSHRAAPQASPLVYTAPKVAETKQPIKVLHAVHTRVTLEAGRGWATVPPPKPPKVAETGQPI